jgi:hypothetical protein
VCSLASVELKINDRRNVKKLESMDGIGEHHSE